MLSDLRHEIELLTLTLVINITKYTRYCINIEDEKEPKPKRLFCYGHNRAALALSGCSLQ
ncbi:hypothetical protein CH54_124 [Yersinia rochesterensis]|uniref:Uncharacterized protein n=1 Tax=Yersinia rochesterensis TaxID=1604335 RepID=A0ABN4FKP7_9GAMM|nr:hypothetical protein AW19_1539 [Yersinia frederiksenii Y225]AJJ37431.1 hypothetical protein CH54_124 [Yersinia rochesterensis]